LPKTPDELLKLVVEDPAYIDNNIMPLVLLMGKTHVESINTLRSIIKDRPMP
jgi:hypothetical protein